jgi:hypothetical protein
LGATATDEDDRKSGMVSGMDVVDNVGNLDGTVGTLSSKVSSSNSWSVKKEVAKKAKKGRNKI